MSNPSISIIIPVYGVEKHIAKCIESIKKQAFTDFEVILVNDGTKDSSIEIAKEVISGDERFVILHKENGGQGSARNLGLDKARGDYIAFVDSDDYVEPSFLQAMYEKVIDDSADICTCDVNIVSPSGSVVRQFKSDVASYVSKGDYLNVYFFISNWMWDKLFKRDVFEELRFDSSIKTYEDAHLVFRLIYGKKITSISKCLYNYVQHQGSTSNDMKPSYFTDRVSILKAQSSFAEKNHIGDEGYLVYLYLVNFLHGVIKTLAIYSSDYSLEVRRLNKVIDYDKFSFKNIYFVFKQKRKIGISLLVFRISPFLYRQFIKLFFQKA